MCGWARKVRTLVLGVEIDHAVAEAIADRVRRWRAAAVRVVDVDWRVGQDSEGDVALYLHVTLTNPAGDTWPRAAMSNLRRTVRAIADEVELVRPVYIDLRPESEEPGDDDEGSPSAVA